jgi:thioredoxin 1
MNYSAVFLAAILVLLVGYFGNIYLARFRLIGSKNPDAGDNQNDWQVYYFHSPSCGACKSITPWVIEQSDQNPNIISVDISKDLEAARKFNIRATPTTVLIEKDIVQDVQLGAGILPVMQAFIENHSSK